MYVRLECPLNSVWLKLTLFVSEHSIVGFAMYYFTYDPWIGKLLYLEDFYVMAEYRGMCHRTTSVASCRAS